MLLSPLTLGTSSEKRALPRLTLTPLGRSCPPTPLGSSSSSSPAWIVSLVAMAARSRSPKARGDAAEASGLSLKARNFVRQEFRSVPKMEGSSSPLFFGYFGGGFSLTRQGILYVKNFVRYLKWRDHPHPYFLAILGVGFPLQGKEFCTSDTLVSSRNHLGI